MRIAVVGGGIFGVTAALSLRARGHDVALFDPGPLPHPLAESTDISKVVRLDYGADDGYLTLMEAAIAGFRRWNALWNEPLFHEVGVTFLARAPMVEGGFEHDSFARLTARGWPIERLDAAAIASRFPAWSTGVYVDGYFNPIGGYAESGRIVARLVEDARRAGIHLFDRCAFVRLHEQGSRVIGIVTDPGGTHLADRVVMAAGAWVPFLLPHLGASLRASGQPVFHLLPKDPALFEPARFPVFGADIAGTGYYGFPLGREGVVKIANHGIGRPMHPGDERARIVSPDQEAALRAFLRDTFPALVDAPIVHTRVCVYGDTWDGHFWIAPDPDHEGLVIAAGGSGHAFKFAPVLGDIIADATEGAANPWLDRFRHRPDVRPARAQEAARHQG
ncbi:Sarcosine oxidase [Minicystis rosea]|nr:Sarcosine oxidase [Minicystis rosea]